MLIPLFIGDDSTTTWGCPYTSDSPMISGEIDTLPRQLNGLVLRLTVYWEDCLLLLLSFLLSLTCMIFLFLYLILSTAQTSGDARSPLTLYQTHGQTILFEYEERCSYLDCLASLSCSHCRLPVSSCVLI